MTRIISTADPAPRPLRSVLYVPGSNGRALDKAPSLAADAIVVDLEDAVAPSAKPDARAAALQALRSGAFAAKQTVLRVNDGDSEWHADDVAAAVEGGFDAMLVPKIRAASDILELSAALDAAGAAPGMALWAMIEMPGAIVDIAAIAASARQTRLHAFVLGFNDLAKEMGARGGDNAIWNPVRLQIALAARAHGVRLIDSVYNDFRDEDGLRGECGYAAALGFDGKSLIHPGQVAIANSLFAPDEAELAKAQAIVAAFERPENADKGVIQIDGEMVERLHLANARQTLAMAAAMSND